MLVQYLEHKRHHPEALLFFQVGDFYESFFDDAVVLSKALNVTLTSRDKNSANPVPMAGVPVSVAEAYIERLVDQGFSVAVVSQVGEIGKNGVERRLEKIVTPSLRIVGSGNSADRVLLAIAVEPKSSYVALAWTSPQSARITFRELSSLEELNSNLAQIEPAELITESGSSGELGKQELNQLAKLFLVPHVRRKAELSSRRELLSDSIDGYANLSPLAKRAVKLLLVYLDELTVENIIKFEAVEVSNFHDRLKIDAVTRRHLELLRNASDNREEGSLFHAINRTATELGKRALKSSISEPYANKEKIEARLNGVEFLKNEYSLRLALEQSLTKVVDIERIATRIQLKRVTPRELGAVRDSLKEFEKIAALLQESLAKENRDLSEIKLVDNISRNILPDAQLLNKLKDILSDSPPQAVKEGIVQAGVLGELDRIRQIKEDGVKWISLLETREKERSGISSLKIRYNNVLGYFFEVTRVNLEKVPADFIRRQSTAQAERFTTLELKEREEELNSADGKILAIEREIFESLVAFLDSYCRHLRELARELAELDIMISFAKLAEELRLSKPELCEDDLLEIKGGSHPVLMQLLKGKFVANDLLIDEKRLSLITGPNMGGKSTFLRQAALIAILAHAGSYVPAQYAKIGICDAIFSRIGSGDNLLEGESTFMLEMRETATILKRATSSSLVIVDEIGRGTATRDGLALARAILEALLLNVKAKTLFATHFHELSHLNQEDINKRINFLTVEVAKKSGEIVFTHTILQGLADESFGVEVAAKAGIPEEVVKRSKYYLEQLNKSDYLVTKESSNQLSFSDYMRQANLLQLQSAQQNEQADQVEKLRKVGEELLSFELDDTTPREAHRILCRLQSQLKKDV
jgi:DNA mismatch repair protein MutS